VTPRRRATGFTLIELTVALTILSIVVMFIYQILQNSVKGQEIVRRGLQGPKIQNALLTQIFRDFRYLYWTDFSGSTGFFGRNGRFASRVDFVTTRASRFSLPEDAATGTTEIGASPLTEVGYACTKDGDYLTLWRREDFFVDDDPVEGGVYTQVFDRLRQFSLRYYPPPEEASADDQGRQKGAEEWDSRVRKTLPYAVLLQIEFDVDDQEGDLDRRDAQKITRIILLRGGAHDSVEWPQPAAAGAQPGR
jgi:prepilin-type N-terminal cleavage/methylation domain-containing protein